MNVPRTILHYDPDQGGPILFVGGPKDGQFIAIPPHQWTTIVAERKPLLRWDDTDPPLHFTETRYHIHKIPWGLKGHFWWIMEHESVKPIDVTLTYLLVCERRALDAMFPEQNFFAQSLAEKWETKHMEIVGLKIPHPPMFPGIHLA